MSEYESNSHLKKISPIRIACGLRTHDFEGLLLEKQWDFFHSEDKQKEHKKAIKLDKHEKKFKFFGPPLWP